MNVPHKWCHALSTLPFPSPLQCYAHRSKHCTIACWDSAKTHTGHGVPKLEKNPHVEKFPESSGLGICPLKAILVPYLMLIPPMIRVRGMRTHQLNTDITEVMCSWHMFRAWKSTTGQMQLQTAAGKGNSILLHLPLSSSSITWEMLVFFTKASAFFISEPCVALKLRSTCCVSLVLSPGRMMEKR